MVTVLASTVNPQPWRLDSCELSDRLPQTATVAVMLDLDVVTGGLFIPHAATVALLPTAFERAEASRLPALAPPREHERGHCLRLAVSTPTLAAIRLDQSEDAE